MQISAAHNSLPSRPIEPNAPSAPASRPSPPPQDNTSLRRVAALLTMLQNKPEIRPEVLARGRALAADPNYPTPAIINKLAGLIVG
ncbi:MAG: hypothetical protein QOE70_5942 [Chthoniobacter sp.]|nr:hypothetical protein [Chthoniobacter sp.]